MSLQVRLVALVLCLLAVSAASAAPSPLPPAFPHPSQHVPTPTSASSRWESAKQLTRHGGLLQTQLQHRRAASSSPACVIDAPWTVSAAWHDVFLRLHVIYEDCQLLTLQQCSDGDREAAADCPLTVAAISYSSGQTVWRWPYSNSSTYSPQYWMETTSPWALQSSDGAMLFIQRLLDSSNATTQCYELVGLHRSSTGVKQAWTSPPLCADGPWGQQSSPWFNAQNVRVDGVSQDIIVWTAATLTGAGTTQWLTIDGASGSVMRSGVWNGTLVYAQQRTASLLLLYGAPVPYQPTVLTTTRLTEDGDLEPVLQVDRQPDSIELSSSAEVVWFTDLSSLQGVNISTNQPVWTLHNDSILIQNDWAGPDYQMVYWYDQPHPTQPSLSIISSMAVNLGNKTAIGIVAIYDTRTGKRVVDSGVLGPRAVEVGEFVLQRWLDTPDAGRSLAFYLVDHMFSMTIDTLAVMGEYEETSSSFDFALSAPTLETVSAVAMQFNQTSYSLFGSRIKVRHNESAA